MPTRDVEPLAAAGRIELVEFAAAPDALLEELSVRLADEHVERALGMVPAAAVASRAERDRLLASLHLVLVVDGAPAGWTGWIVYPADRRFAETTTYLCPTWWGSGLNSCAKALLWAAAHTAGVPLVASVHAENHRSLAAVRRLWPQVEAQVVFEEHKQRVAHLFRLEGPPATEATWPTGTVAHVAARLAALRFDA